MNLDVTLTNGREVVSLGGGLDLGQNRKKDAVTVIGSGVGMSRFAADTGVTFDMKQISLTGWKGTVTFDANAKEAGGQGRALTVKGKLTLDCTY